MIDTATVVESQRQLTVSPRDISLDPRGQAIRRRPPMREGGREDGRLAESKPRGRVEEVV